MTENNLLELLEVLPISYRYIKQRKINSAKQILKVEESCTYSSFFKTDYYHIYRCPKLISLFIDYD
jgi:hypothetical protein